MLFAEKESNLIEHFQMLETNEILLLPESEELKNVVSSILNLELWKKWIDSSAKDAPPPDFYSDELGLMMEVMRVDDHGFKKKGKIINPTYEKEHKLENELRQVGFLSKFSNAQLQVIADSGLPTEQDHNYNYYFENFKRTVEKHIEHISQYKENHPNHKLIFFIFDESSAYIEKIKSNRASTLGSPHLFMLDKKFLDVFVASKIDYLIWYAPYKLLQTDKGILNLPQACVFKVGVPLPAEYTYDANKMVSAEK